jgi:hypothetical protein
MKRALSARSEDHSSSIDIKAFSCSFPLILAFRDEYSLRGIPRAMPGIKYKIFVQFHFEYGAQKKWKLISTKVAT